MSCKRFLLRLLVIPIMLCLSEIQVLAQLNISDSIRVMFYNVENLFDTIDDTIVDDNEFLPSGLRNWTLKRYYNKLNSVFKTIAGAGSWSPPEIIGLAEIENEGVLKDLLEKTYLAKYNYGVIHEDSPDLRGIDVCLLYRKDIVQIINQNSWIPENYHNGDFLSRSVLYAKCLVKEDTVHFIVNHWPSRIGGELNKGDLRLDIARMVKEKSDSILEESGGKAKIIIMGDFNCEWDDEEIQILTGSGIDISKSGLNLVNLSEQTAKDGVGTYKYQGKWELLDQIIVSEYLVYCKSGYYTNRELFRVFSDNFLLRIDLKYPGKTPFSTFLGHSYLGGYSDHLPVILSLRLK